MRNPFKVVPKSLEQLNMEELYHAQTSLLVAEAELERAQANRDMLVKRVKRLTTQSGVLHTKRVKPVEYEVNNALSGASFAQIRKAK